MQSEAAVSEAVEQINAEAGGERWDKVRSHSAARSSCHVIPGATTGLHCSCSVCVCAAHGAEATLSERVHRKQTGQAPYPTGCEMNGHLSVYTVLASLVPGSQLINTKPLCTELL